MEENANKSHFIASNFVIHPLDIFGVQNSKSSPY